MMAYVDEVWADRLRAKMAPEAMAVAMVRAGAILTGYELVKSSILEQPKSLLANEWNSTGQPVIGAEYRSKVLTGGRNAWTGSCAWLVEAGALTAEQVEALDRIRAHRGDVAHELARLLVDPDADVEAGMLVELRSIMRSLDRFWGAIEVDINPDFDGRRDDIDHDGIQSGSGLLLDYLCNLAGLE